MIEMNELTYAAIITITLPGVAEPVTLTVLLTPLSDVTTDGRVKRLRDCTLADLQTFADSLEAKLWADYQAIRLVDLADADEAAVRVTILNESDQALPAAETWLDHAVVLPPGAATTPAEPPPAINDTAETDTAVEAPEAMPEEQPEPEVTVAETELLLPAGRRELRIAGRRRPLAHPTWAAADILINEAAFRDCQAHALSSMDREVAGVLIGPPPEKQPDGRYVVHITDSIIAKHTRMHGASVTYTPESWRYVNDRLGELYPDESAVMVGWYHTHPGFGIFLSSMDLFIHQNFFTQLWHVAFVLDPVARRSGFFCWDRAKTQVKPYEFPWPAWATHSW